MDLLISFVISTLFSAVCLWVAMKVTGVDGTFIAMLLIAAICAVVGLVPFVGRLAALVLMFVLIRRWTSANVWPDAVLMVVVAWVVSIAASVMLAGALA